MHREDPGEDNDTRVKGQNNRNEKIVNQEKREKKFKRH